MTRTPKLALKRESLPDLQVTEMSEVVAMSISCPLVRIKEAAEAFVAAVSAEVPSCTCPIGS